MAYASPATRSSGYVVGATDWNLLVTNERWLAQSDTDGRPMCRAYRSTNLSVANNTTTAITWNAETLDNSSIHSISSNTSRLTAPVDGRYKAISMVQWASNATGWRGIGVIPNGGAVYESIDTRPAANGTETTQIVEVPLLPLTAGQYCEILGTQTSGGNLNVVGGAGFASWAVLLWEAAL